MRRDILHLAGTLFIIATTVSVAAAGPAGIWLGDQTKDPMTDKNNSLAFIYDDRDQGTIGVRCRNGKSDILVTTQTSMFKPGAQQELAIRFGTEEPTKLAAVATEPNILALDAREKPEVYRAMMESGSIALRFAGIYGRQETMQFKAGLRTNSLHMVGRVLADCGISPYPKEEIEKAMRELEADMAPPSGKKPRTQQPKSR